MSNPLPATRVVTGEVRLSFVHLFTPYVNPNSTDKTPKYSVTILIPKSDVATMQRIQAAIQAATAASVPKIWAQHPPQPKTPIWDGDGVRSSGEPFGPECKGHWVMTASSKQPPQIVDIQGNPIINQSEVYSGMYARVSINFFGYSNSGNKGIGAGLGNVQKTNDGESLAGGRSAAEDFGVAPAAPQYAPPAQYQAPTAAPQYAPPQSTAAPQYAPPQSTAAPQYAPPQSTTSLPWQQPAVDPISGEIIR